jgi:hypothetical protein
MRLSRFLKIQFLILFISFSSHAFEAVSDQETIEYLYSKALHYSGLNPVDIATLPPIFQVSKRELNKIVCPTDPENCRNLAAVFDDIGYRILILDDLEISSNFKPYDYSFVIHELVHALQYRQYGAEIIKDCTAIFETEKQAYRVQDKYLASEGAFQRLGHFLKYFYCDEEIAKNDYQKSLEVWELRKKNPNWPHPN